MNDALDIEARKRRVQYRAGHRGLRELDLLLGQFVIAKMDTFDARDLADFEAVLDVGDGTVLGWLMGEPMDAAFDTPVWRRLRAFHTK